MIRKILKWALDREDRLRQRGEAARTVRQLAGERSYSFTRDYVTSHVENWRRHLAGYCGCPGVQMLEIGSYEGRSTVWFIENVLIHPACRMVCVDFFSRPTFDLRFDHNIRLSGAEQKVIKLKGHSEDILPQLSRDTFDIVYVDGSHTAINVLFDALSAWFLLKAGGILIFDDYLWELEKPPSQRPQPAIDLFLDALQGQYELLTKAYQVILRKLPASAC